MLVLRTSSGSGPPRVYIFVRRAHRGTFEDADHLARPCLTFVQTRFGFFAGAASVAGDVRRGLREFAAPCSSASAGWTRTSCCSSARERRPGPGQAKSATSARRRRHRDAKVVSSGVPHTALGFLVASQPTYLTARAASVARASASAGTTRHVVQPVGRGWPTVLSRHAAGRVQPTHSPKAVAPLGVVLHRWQRLVLQCAVGPHATVRRDGRPG